MLDKSSLWKGAPYKPLTKGQNFTGGWSNGRITSRHIGGGSKHKYRIVDFFRKSTTLLVLLKESNTIQIEQLTLHWVLTPNKEKSYIICPQGLKVGDKIESGQNVDIKVGDSLKLGGPPELYCMSTYSWKWRKISPICWIFYNFIWLWQWLYDFETFVRRNKKSQ